MVLTFFTTITDKHKMLEITDKCTIAKDYMSRWFWIDLISIFPFDDFGKIFSLNSTAPGEHSQGESAILLRGMRLSKIGKMVRLMRLVKVFKIMKNSSNITK
jgi:hypothetical protein